MPLNTTVKSRVTFDATDLAKYPFSADAVKYIDSLGFSITDLDSDFGRRILERASERIVSAIKRRRILTLLEDVDTEVLSYPVSILLLKKIQDDILAKIYAVAESKRVYSLLLSEPVEKIVYIAKTTFKWNIKKVLGTDFEEGSWVIHFSHYLSNIPEFSLHWKLVNRVLLNGYVVVSREELARLLEEQIKRFIIEKVHTPAEPQPLTVPKVVEEYVDKLLEEWLPQRTHITHPLREVEVSEEEYPPCIRFLLDKTRRGENLSHVERFALATFMLSIGKSVDEVVKIFSSMPDFNEAITRYQVEHLAGLKGSRKKYSPFKCENMRTHGICIPDKKCEGIRHPLQYFLFKRRR